MNENENDNRKAAGFDRRTMIKAAAWSAPVIAVAVATPLAAASVDVQPAPGGGRSEWQGGTSVQTWTPSTPQRVQINNNQNVGFIVYDADTGDLEPDDKYTAGVLTVTITWGAGGVVTEPTSYRAQEQRLNGWVRVGALEEGTSGRLTYTYTGIQNGAKNTIPLPVVWLLPSAGGGLTATYVNTSLSSDFLSEKTSGSKVP